MADGTNKPQRPFAQKQGERPDHARAFRMASRLFHNKRSDSAHCRRVLLRRMAFDCPHETQRPGKSVSSSWPPGLTPRAPPSRSLARGPLTPTNMDEVPSMGETGNRFLIQPVRELYKFCLDAAAHHRDGAKVDQILEVIESAQDKDPASKTYGNFRWRASEPKVDDQNSVEFAMQSAISLWTLHRDALSKESQDRVQRMILLAVEGIKRHEVKISYTNMALMKIQNQTLIGEAFNQPALVEEAGHSMDLWLKETATNGIHEYVSPTYYGTDFDSLGLLARFAKDPEIRRKALAGIRAIWIDIAANWFEPCRRLSGSHARDYDVLHSRGYLDVQLLGAGFITREESTQKGSPSSPSSARCRSRTTSRRCSRMWFPAPSSAAGVPNRSRGPSTTSARILPWGPAATVWTPRT